MKSKSYIPIVFEVYAPYAESNIPDNTIRAGDLDSLLLEPFLRALATTSRKNTKCIALMCAHYMCQANVVLGQDANSNRAQKFKSVDNGSISITNMFFKDNTPQCIRHKNRIRTEANKLHICAQSLREGKCVDPVIQQTLERFMYPNNYYKRQR